MQNLCKYNIGTIVNTYFKKEMSKFVISSCHIECDLCLDVFTDPRILPCGHTFCFQCLCKVDAASDDRICIVCRTPWSEPKEGLLKLPKNYTIAAVASVAATALLSTASSPTNIASTTTTTTTSTATISTTQITNESFSLFKKNLESNCCELNNCEVCLKQRSVIPSLENKDNDKIQTQAKTGNFLQYLFTNYISSTQHDASGMPKDSVTSVSLGMTPPATREPSSEKKMSQMSNNINETLKKPIDKSSKQFTIDFSTGSRIKMNCAYNQVLSSDEGLMVVKRRGLTDIIAKQTKKFLQRIPNLIQISRYSRWITEIFGQTRYATTDPFKAEMQPHRESKLSNEHNKNTASNGDCSANLKGVKMKRKSSLSLENTAESSINATSAKIENSTAAKRLKRAKKESAINSSQEPF